MVADMRGMMGMYVDGLNGGPKKDGRGAILVSNMNIRRLITYVQQVDKKSHHEKEEFRSKKAKTSSLEVGKKGSGNKFLSEPAPSFASAPMPRTRNDQRSQNFIEGS